MKNKKPSCAKIRAEKTQIETLDEYRNTIKFLEAKCLRLEEKLSKLSQHDVIKNEVAVCDCKKYGIQHARMCSAENCVNKLDQC